MTDTRTVNFFRLMKEPDQTLLQHEWNETKRWLKRPSTIFAIFLLAIGDALVYTAFLKVIFWAYLLDDRVRKYLVKEKLEELTVAPVRPEMLFPAILMRPVAAYTIIAFAGIPFSIGIALVAQFFARAMMGIAATQNPAIATETFGAMQWIGFLASLLILPIAACVKFFAALAVSAYVAKKMILKQSILAAFLRAGLVIVAVGILTGLITLLLAIPLLILGAGGMSWLQVFNGNPAQAASLGVLIYTYALAAIATVIPLGLYWLIYRSEMRVLQSSWLRTQFDLVMERG